MALSRYQTRLGLTGAGNQGDVLCLPMSVRPTRLADLIGQVDQAGTLSRFVLLALTGGGPMEGTLEITLADRAMKHLLPRVQTLVQTAEAECGVTYVAVPRPMYLVNDANGKPITEMQEFRKVKRCIEERLCRAS